MTGNTITHTEIDDGKQDLGIKVNGHVLIHMPEAGYKSLGITYEQAKHFIKTMGELFFAFANAEAESREVTQPKERE